jgi:tRNA(Ile)-lysidine synthase
MRPIALADVFKPGERVLCAVSGGADSVALLLLLKDRADEGSIRLVAAHFDHRIRPTSSQDARFVRALCQRLNIGLVEGSADVPALARARGEGLETAARNARRAFLQKTCAQVGADVIATAHHADDQAETVLMHLFRGAGRTGAAGIAPRAGRWARPLLEYRKKDLGLFLANRGQNWCDDETNALPDTPRNRLRSEFLPMAEGVYPGAVGALGRFAAISLEEDELLDALARDFLARHLVSIDAGLCALEVASQAHRALVRRALRRVCPRAACDYGISARLTALYFAPSGRLDVAGVRAERAGKRLYIFRGNEPAQAFLGTIREASSKNRPVYENGYRQVLDRAAVGKAILRTRQPGDWIRPLGTSGRKSLSDYMIDRKIDRPMRDRVPVLAEGSEVLWVVGVGISARAALSEGSEAVELTYIPKRNMEERANDP